MPKKTKPSSVIFTDLDGTLLDWETYSWKPAETALKTAAKKNVPVVFCSSKTRSEIEVYRKKMKNRHPFICENGEAVFIPEGYFSKKPSGSRKKGPYHVLVLGKPYKELRKVILEMKKKGIKVRGFGDMSLDELVKHTGLPRDEARLAKKREYDEPFLIEKPEQRDKALEFARKKGLQVTRGGRFHHLLGNNDKGLAVKLLTDYYSWDSGIPIVSAGIGDSPNDYTMLRAVHVPYLLRNKSSEGKTPMAFIRVDNPGPMGWSKAVTDFLLSSGV